MEEKENLDRAVCSIRLSKDDSKNPSLSPINQEKICRAYAESKNDEIVEVYRDIKTGTNLDRPDFQRMMSDARAGKFKRIYVKKWDRLSRDIADMEITIKELSSLGIIVISCDGNNDPKQRQILTMMNQWMIDDMRDKTEMQHSLLIKKGEAVVPAPFGYKYPFNTKKTLPNGKRNKKFDPDAPKIFIVDEKKAEDLRQIFNYRINGIPIKDIAKKYHKSVMGIHLILRNKVYLGLLCYRGEYYQGHHISIISEDVFDKIQEINEGNKRNVAPKIV